MRVSAYIHAASMGYCWAFLDCSSNPYVGPLRSAAGVLIVLSQCPLYMDLPSTWVKLW
jgi:hypothetical protein